MCLQPIETVDETRRFRVTDTLKDGTHVIIRAVAPDDREKIARAFHNLERKTVYSRFFSYKDSLSEAELDRIADIDFSGDVMLVATIGEGDGETSIGEGSYFARAGADGRPVAEGGFTVEEDYQGLGIAGRLLKHLARIACNKGILRFDADVLAHNRAMLYVLHHSGFPMTRSADRGVVHVSLTLTQASDAGQS